MNCYFHSERESVGVCFSCGKPVCPECKVVLQEKVYCNPCVNKLLFDKTEAGPTRANTISLQDSPAVIEKEIMRWNWGAFFLTWIWAIGNKLWVWLIIGLAAYAIAFVPSPNNKTMWISMICQGVISVFLGVKGSEWAWKSKKWDSIGHFKRTQRKWRNWGIVFTAVGFIIGIIIGSTSLPSF